MMKGGKRTKVWWARDGLAIIGRRSVGVSRPRAPTRPIAAAPTPQAPPPAYEVAPSPPRSASLSETPASVATLSRARPARDGRGSAPALSAGAHAQRSEPRPTAGPPWPPKRRDKPTQTARQLLGSARLSDARKQRLDGAVIRGAVPVEVVDRAASGIAGAIGVLAAERTINALVGRRAAGACGWLLGWRAQRAINAAAASS